MTSSARTSITALPRGHELPPATFTVSRDAAAAYLRAVGDAHDYGESVPPLAAVAHALRALQDTVALPDGALHTGQEVQHLAPVSAGAELTMHARIAQRSERQGFVIAILEYEIAAAGSAAVRARTTIMAPGGAT